MYIFTERQVFSLLPFLGELLFFKDIMGYHMLRFQRLPVSAGNAYVLGRMHTGAKALPAGEASYKA